MKKAPQTSITTQKPNLDFDVFSTMDTGYNSNLVAFDGTWFYTSSDKKIIANNITTGASKTIYQINNDYAISRKLIKDYLCIIYYEPTDTSGSPYQLVLIDLKTEEQIHIRGLKDLQAECYVHNHYLYLHDKSISENTYLRQLYQYDLSASDVTATRKLISTDYYLYRPTQRSHYLFFNAYKDMDTMNKSTLVRLDLLNGEMKHYPLNIGYQISPVSNDNWILVFESETVDITDTVSLTRYVLSVETDEQIPIDPNSACFGIIGDVLVTSRDKKLLLTNLRKGTSMTLDAPLIGKGGSYWLEEFSEPACVTFGGVSSYSVFYHIYRSGNTMKAKPIQLDFNYTPDEFMWEGALFCKGDWLYFYGADSTIQKKSLLHPERPAVPWNAKT